MSSEYHFSTSRRCEDGDEAVGVIRVETPSDIVNNAVLFALIVDFLSQRGGGGSRCLALPERGAAWRVSRTPMPRGQCVRLRFLSLIYAR